MDDSKKIEKLKERAGVTYEEAENALKACDGDLLDAMVFLEKIGKVSAPETEVVTTSRTEHSSFADVEDKVRDYDRVTGEKDMGQKLKRGFLKFIDIIKNNDLKISREGKELVKIPLWIAVIVCLVLWKLIVVAVIISLFFGIRYSFEGRDKLEGANMVADKATEAVNYVKDKFEKL